MHFTSACRHGRLSVGGGLRLLLAFGGRELSLALALLHEPVVFGGARPGWSAGRQAAGPLRHDVAHPGADLLIDGRAAGQGKRSGCCHKRDQSWADTAWHGISNTIWGAGQACGAAVLPSTGRFGLFDVW